MASAEMEFGAELPPEEQKVIGPYRLLRLLGEGGMGSVYLAEQEEPVRRLVALKLVKAGMDSKQVLARFELEKQNLAELSHPSIAQVYDAGLTDEKRPFFAMEFVDGLPITQYCDQKRLSIPDRLKLFIKVCGAVQHAHQRGIIHRDLKPANILVTEKEGETIPKIIDFGISKALKSNGGEGATIMSEVDPITQIGAVVGTIGYMSPEQATLEQKVDTRSDVYSLGAVLYELFTSRAPFTPEDFKGVPLPVIFLKMASKNPAKPSSRINKTAETKETVAQERSLTPKRLNRLLRRDLDWIVMRALEREKDRRYNSPLDLADDLNRYLEQKPVNAGPPGLLYITQKFIQRNKIAVAVLFLIAGGTAFGIYRTQVEAHKAQNEARRTQETLATMDFLLLGANPAKLGRDVKYLEVLNAFGEQIEKENLDQDIKAKLYYKLGVAFLNIRISDKARAYFKKTKEEIVEFNNVEFEIEYLYKVFEATESLSEASRSLQQGLDLAIENEHRLKFLYIARMTDLKFKMGFPDEAKKSYLTFSENIFERFDYFEMYYLVQYLIDAGEHKEVVEKYEWMKSQEAWKEFSDLYKFGMGSSVMMSYLYLGETPKALDIVDFVIPILEEFYQNDVAVYVNTLKNCSKVYLRNGNPEKAVALLSSLKDYVNVDEYLLNEIDSVLAACYLDMDDYEKAIMYVEKIYRYQREKFGELDRATIFTLINFCSVCCYVGRSDEAIALLEKYQDVIYKNYGKESLYSYQSYYIRAKAYFYSKKYNEALKWSRLALEKFSGDEQLHWVKILMVERLLLRVYAKTNHEYLFGELYKSTLEKHLNMYGENNKFVLEVYSTKKEI